VIAKRMDARPPVSLVMAIPDHPWTKATRDAAAVRIAMTVAEAGKREGVLLEVVRESGLDTDAPEVVLSEAAGKLHADLSAGVNVTSVQKLRANSGICHDGVKLHGSGFITTELEATALGLGRREGLETFVRPYRNGRDLAARSRKLLVIDLFGMDESEVRRRFPEIYQHLLQTVRSARREQVERSHTADAEAYLSQWWVFGKPRPELRPALVGLPNYIATVDTAAHRVFQFLPTEVVCDDKVVLIASDEQSHLGILSSAIHVTWATRLGGWLGMGNDSVYVKTKTFDPFLFPDATPEQRRIIGDLAEELDATRKEVLGEHGDLTLTGLYNLREKLKKGEAFTPAEQDARTRGRVDIIAELHDRIDDAVADAYGWPRDLSDEEIVGRLVALNAERHREEQAGTVRWLRPDYQIPRAGLTQLPVAARPEQIEALLPDAKARKPAFPRDAIGQTAAVLDELRGGGALSAADIARRYAQGLKVERRIGATLEALARLGHLVVEGGGYRLRKAA